QFDRSWPDRLELLGESLVHALMRQQRLIDLVETLFLDRDAARRLDQAEEWLTGVLLAWELDRPIGGDPLAVLEELTALEDLAAVADGIAQLLNGIEYVGRARTLTTDLEMLRAEIATRHRELDSLAATGVADRIAAVLSRDPQRSLPLSRLAWLLELDPDQIRATVKNTTGLTLATGPEGETVRLDTQDENTEPGTGPDDAGAITTDTAITLGLTATVVLAALAAHQPIAALAAAVIGLGVLAARAVNPKTHAAPAGWWTVVRSAVGRVATRLREARWPRAPPARVLAMAGLALARVIVGVSVQRAHQFKGRPRARRLRLSGTVGSGGGGTGITDAEAEAFGPVVPELIERAEVRGDSLPFGLDGPEVVVLDPRRAAPLLPAGLDGVPDRLIAFIWRDDEHPSGVIVVFAPAWDELLELTRLGLLAESWWQRLVDHEVGFHLEHLDSLAGLDHATHAQRLVDDRQRARLARDLDRARATLRRIEELTEDDSAAPRLLERASAELRAARRALAGLPAEQARRSAAKVTAIERTVS
ncbi:MAG: hypothetical protein J2P20_20790, partial [Pseudonocardia sp.]|nr:hypothetical protein [Pseudonocardia sp.]